MELHVLHIIDKEQNEIKFLKSTLPKQRGAHLVKGWQYQARGELPLRCPGAVPLSKEARGWGLHGQDPVSGTFVYFNYPWVNSWNFGKPWKHPSSYIVSKWCLLCQSLPPMLHRDLSSCSRGQWEKLSQIKRALKASQSLERMSCLLRLPPLPYLSLWIRLFDCHEGLGTCQKTWPGRVIYVAVPLGLEGQG